MRKRLRRDFAIVVAALCLVAAADDPKTPAEQLARAKRLYEANERDESRVWAQRAADQGLAEAWFWLGYTMNGDATPYYEKAAEGGYPQAYQYLFDALLFRAGGKADVAKAKRFADLARKQNAPPPYDDPKMFTTIDRCFEAGSATPPRGDVPRDADGAPVADDARGDVALAESYANGWGVKRNPQLAIALLCRSSDVPAELESMVDELYETKDERALDEPFVFCDHVTSGMNGGRCAAEAEAKASAKRDQAVAALTRTWSAPQKAAFARLEGAAHAFFQEHARLEVDQTGTARAQMTIDEEAELRDAFVAAIRDFEARRFPRTTNFEDADRALNAAYAKAMKPGALGDAGTVRASGVKKTQRLWIPYRDAWVALAALRYPSLSADDVKAWLSEQRTRQLAELVEE
jgi:uncharacterized protein YecT (DUF1311 family)